MIVQGKLVVALSTAGLSFALLLGGAAASHAAFPGKNGKIVFTRGEFFPENFSSVFSISSTGKHLHRLTKKRVPGSDEFPSVSPNGKTIAFDSDRSGVAQIFKMKLSGKGEHAITKGTEASFDAAWSPDGRKIAFAGIRNGKGGLFTMRANGTHQRRVTSIGPDTFAERWSLDGKWLAFQSDNDGDFDLYVIRTNGKHMQQLTDDAGFDGDAEFSPNGRKMLFASSRTGSGDIYQMNLDGSHVKRITKSSANESAPAYSPDGRSIVFVRGSHLFTATRKGKHPHQLTNSPVGDFGAIWGPRP